MRVSQHTQYGVSTNIFFLNKGEKVAKHNHPDGSTHTTNCVQGRSRVTIFRDIGATYFEMQPTDRDYELPPLLFHEVEALEDNTIVVHIAKETATKDIPSQQPFMQPPPPNGGVLDHEGNVVYT